MEHNQVKGILLPFNKINAKKRGANPLSQKITNMGLVHTSTKPNITPLLITFLTLLDVACRTLQGNPQRLIKSTKERK